MIRLAPTRDRLATLLMLVLLCVPGSPALLFDGLPLNGRLEVGALLITVIVALSRTTRSLIHGILSVGNRRSAFVLVLATLVFLKIFTFMRFPIGDNFETCLKSTYRPVGETCEKSFDYLFHSNDGVNGLGDITRVDSQIDFRTTSDSSDSTLGASHSTWNLPFQNDYPRFSELWMDRLPFTARVGAVFSAPAESLLPVEFVGDLSVSTAAGVVSDTSFEFRKLMLIRLLPGQQDLRLSYAFSDTDSSEVPDRAPVPRGPYAHLVVGQPVSRLEPLPVQLNVRGYAINLKDNREILGVVVRSPDRRYRAVQEERPDLFRFFKRPQNLGLGFRLDLDLLGPLVEFENLDVVAMLDDGKEIVVGEIRRPDESLANLSPISTLVQQDVIAADFATWFSTGENMELLRAEHRIKPSLISKLLLLILNGAHTLVFFGLLLATVVRRVTERRRLAQTLALAVAVGVIVWFSYRYPVPYIAMFLPQPFMSVALVITPLAWLRAAKRGQTVVYVAVTSVVTAAPLALRAFRSFTGLSGAEWWGFMIFRDRPIDWFVFQGYAYQILVQQSLRAGEGVFYFMPGSRYVVFFTHIIFGNNDVLIGIIIYSGLILSSLLVVNRLFEHLVSNKELAVFVIGTSCVFLGISYSALSTQLSISSSSETFAWTLFFLVTVLILRLEMTTPSAQLVCTLGASLGFIVFLRPNYLMISVCLLIATATILGQGKPARDPHSTLLLLGWLVFGFVVTFSLPLLHNVYFGETVNFFTNRNDPKQTVFEPSQILRILTDPTIREVVIHKFVRFLYWQKPSGDAFLITSWISQLLYVFAVVIVAKSRRRIITSVVLLLAPPTYVLSSAPFGIMTIPERQFGMASLALAASAVLAVVVVRRDFRPRRANEIEASSGVAPPMNSTC